MDDAEDLIERLLTQAGALMEDASATAIISGETPQRERIARLMVVTADIRALLEAAAASQRTRERPANS